MKQLSKIVRCAAMTSALWLAACKGGSGDVDKAFAEFSTAYKTTYQEVTHTGVDEVQQAVWAAGDAGKPLQPEVDALTKKVDALRALVTDANTQVDEGRKKGDAALVKKATATLGEAHVKADALKAEAAAFLAKVPAAKPTP